jgi:serine/threonine protein kinase
MGLQCERAARRQRAAAGDGGGEALVSSKFPTPTTTAGAGRQLAGAEPRPRRPTQPYSPRLDRGREDAPAGGTSGREALSAWRLDGVFASDACGPHAGAPRAIDPHLPAHLFARPRPRPRPPARGVAAVREPPDADENFELEAGAILDKYRIEELLGVGGFGLVYLATHLLLRTQVAIKMLRPRLLRRRPGLAAALCQEARFAARIDHPNVARVLDVTHGPEITYVVMEYVEGRTLARAIQERGALPSRAVVRIGLDVAAGLRAGLAQGLIHRDIKSANIILTPLGRAKIVDLGLASTITSLDASGAGTLGAPAPAGPAPVGTHGYMPPELARQPSSVDFRSDIYALGVTLYHAAVGRLPFPADDPRRCLEMHCSEPVRPAHEVDPRVPETLSRVLQWMLAKNIADRPESYDALRSALKAVLQSLLTVNTMDANDD